MIKVKIINKPISPFVSDDSRKQDGAELVFNGRVRNTEHGKEIIALELYKQVSRDFPDSFKEEI